MLTPTRQARPRLTYVDNLRIMLMSLVILVHLAITYGAPVGDWFYVEQGASNLPAQVAQAFFIIASQAFFMGMFFLISAYFTAGSFDRKGSRAFLIDRLKRLGIPLLLFFFVINPLTSYVAARGQGFGGTLADFVGTAGLDVLGVGPLWFVEGLLYFALLYALWRRLRGPAPAPADRPLPSNMAIALFGLGLGLAAFALRLVAPVGWYLEPLHFQVGHWVQYVALYAVGVVAYQRNWQRLSDAQSAPWRWVALVLLLLLPVLFLAGGAIEEGVDPFMGGLHWQALVYAIWEQVAAVSIIITLLTWFRRRLNRQSAVFRAASDATFATYVFHPAVLVLLALTLTNIHLDLSLKFLLVAPFALALAFGVGWLVRRAPLARDIF
jgi:glucans biosynthesis protein C